MHNHNPLYIRLQVRAAHTPRSCHLGESQGSVLIGDVGEAIDEANTLRLLTTVCACSVAQIYFDPDPDPDTVIDANLFSVFLSKLISIRVLFLDNCDRAKRSAGPSHTPK